MSEVLDRMINEGYNKGINEGEARGIRIGEARGREETKLEYEAKLAEMKAELEKYKAMVMKA